MPEVPKYRPTQPEIFLDLTSQGNGGVRFSERAIEAADGVLIEEPFTIEIRMPMTDQNEEIPPKPEVPES